MDVKTLCLGVLTEGDKTGYEIKRRFEEAFHHFFVAGYGSIYPALADLTGQGLVTCESVLQDKRPDKKVYSLTPAGRHALVDELCSTPPRHKVRSEFLVLMYFAHLLPPARVAAVAEQMVEAWGAQVAGIEHCLQTMDQDSAATPGMRFAAGYGRAVWTAAMAYVRENQDQLVKAVAGEHPEAVPLAAAE